LVIRLIAKVVARHFDERRALVSRSSTHARLNSVDELRLVEHGDDELFVAVPKCHLIARLEDEVRISSLSTTVRPCRTPEVGGPSSRRAPAAAR
jgi:hypothetical protein